VRVVPPSGDAVNWQTCSIREADVPGEFVRFFLSASLRLCGNSSSIIFPQRRGGAEEVRKGTDDFTKSHQYLLKKLLAHS
jgi:hypothetical protein